MRAFVVSRLHAASVKLFYLLLIVQQVTKQDLALHFSFQCTELQLLQRSTYYSVDLRTKMHCKCIVDVMSSDEMLFDRARKFAWVKMTWKMQSAVHSPQSTTRLTRAWDKLIILKRSRHQQLATAGMDICTPLVSLAAVFLFFFFLFFFLFPWNPQSQ